MTITIARDGGTKCRAKMIDGSPVTFEYFDRGEVAFDRAPDGRVYYAPLSDCGMYLSEMIGEGFYVHSVYPDYSLRIQGNRSYADEMALQQSGVNTATAERFAKGEFVTGYAGPVGQRRHWRNESWVPLFPMPREVEFPPGVKINYVGAEGLVTEAMHAPTSDMVAAGQRALLDALNRNVPLDIAITRMWQAMEKERKW